MKYLLLFFFGLSVGSFLNCVIFRLKSEKNLMGRSFCPHCKHILSWKDLIPLFSFLILKGKCRYCRKKISWQYPLVELSTGLLFSLIYFFFSTLYFSLDNFVVGMVALFFLFSIICFSIILFVFDLKYYSIPDKIIYPAIFTSFFFNLYLSLFLFNSLEFFKNSLITTFLSALFFFSLWFFSKGKAMGFGDWEVIVFLGFFLGFPKILICIFSAFFLGAIVSLILIFLKKKTLKSEIPFVPFLIIGALFSFFFGDFIFPF